jgi:DNA-binding transcriptional MerR regulator
LTLERVPWSILEKDPMPTAEDPRILRSGELARRAGVSTDTLRHYERLGLLPKPTRTAAGYRKYPAQTLDRVMMIRRALTVGFTLPELEKILKMFDSGHAPCKHVEALAKAKLAQVEEQLTSLLALRDHLRLLVESWGERMGQTPSGEHAWLLKSLESMPAPEGIKPYRVGKERKHN